MNTHPLLDPVSATETQSPGPGRLPGRCVRVLLEREIRRAFPTVTIDELEAALTDVGGADVETAWEAADRLRVEYPCGEWDDLFQAALDQAHGGSDA